MARDPDSCFDPMELAGLAGGFLPEDRRDRADRHLADCHACRGAVLQVWRAGRRLQVSRLWIFPRRSIAAAAVSILVLAAGAAGFIHFRRGEAPAVRPALETPGVSETIGAPADRSAAFRLPGGTVLVLDPGSAVRFQRPVGGERVHLELIQGTVEAAVAKGDGVFRVASPAGEVRVVGTRFRTRRVRIARPPSPDPGSARPPLEGLCVEVSEGKVLLANSRGEAPISAGIRGILLADRGPVPLEMAATRKGVMAQFAPMVEEAPEGPRIRAGFEPDAELLAALFWGGDWGSSAGGVERLRAEATSREKAALDLMERMRAP